MQNANEGKGASAPRRGLIVAASVVIVVLVAAALCLVRLPSQASAWSAVQDDELPVLTMQVSGGNVVAMPGDGWAARDGYVQLQLSGASIPGDEVASITQEDDTLSVTLSADGDASSLDLMLTEYRLTGGDVASVERVLVTYPDGSTAELQQAYE